jgi:hypothetical protein
MTGVIEEKESIAPTVIQFTVEKKMIKHISISNISKFNSVKTKEQ